MPNTSSIENREVETTSLLNGEQFIFEVRCPVCNKMLAKAILDIQTSGIFQYEKLKTMIVCRFGAATRCTRCGKIRSAQAQV